MHRAQGRGRGELCARCAHFQDIGFVLVNFLNFFAGVIGPNDQCRLRRLSWFEAQGKGRLTRKLLQKSLHGPLEARFGVSG